MDGRLLRGRWLGTNATDVTNERIFSSSSVCVCLCVWFVHVCSAYATHLLRFVRPAISKINSKQREIRADTHKVIANINFRWMRGTMTAARVVQHDRVDSCKVSCAKHNIVRSA